MKTKIGGKIMVKLGTATLRRYCVFVSLVALASFAGQAAAIDENSYYRLTTKWQGPGKSLDVVNDGSNNRLQLAPTGDYSGQSWRFQSVGNGYYRLTTSWQGPGISLDVVNDGRNNKLQLAPTGDYGGQYWKVAPAGNGYYRLTTKWQGPGKSLDVVNDGGNNQLQLADTANVSGQLWKLTAVSKIGGQGRRAAEPAGAAVGSIQKPFGFLDDAPLSISNVQAVDTEKEAQVSFSARWEGETLKVTVLYNVAKRQANIKMVSSGGVTVFAGVSQRGELSRKPDGLFGSTTVFSGAGGNPASLELAIYTR